jgi:hypothetical protein
MTRRPAKAAKSNTNEARTDSFKTLRSPEPCLTSVAQPNSLVPRAMPVDPAVQREMVAQTAYFRAKQRGFEPGQEIEDWLWAESEVDAELTSGGIPHVRSM